jgi:hypothetical protein
MPIGFKAKMDLLIQPDHLNQTLVLGSDFWGILTIQ